MGAHIHDFETHRCEGSLRACCSIRRRYHDGPTTFVTELMLPDDGWHLLSQEFDYDYDDTYMVHVARIDYCPWCGERLEVEA